MVSDFENKQSQPRTSEGEKVIENHDVIFKLHAFLISCFSFNSGRLETHEK